MLDIIFLRENVDEVRRKIARKNADPKLVDRFLELDQKWRVATKQLDDLRAEQRALSKKIAAPGGGEPRPEASSGRDAAKAKKEIIRIKESEHAELERDRELVLMQIPNIPSEDTPIGKDETENKVIRTWGEPTKFTFAPKDHVILGESLGLIESEKAGTISGTRFAYLMGGLVRLQFALVQYALEVLGDEHIIKIIAEKIALRYSAKPFMPVVPPTMIKPEIFQKMARLEPKDDRYYIPSDDVYLVGSAEHTLGPLHMDETLTEDKFPIRYVGYSTSFRREAGSYGQDTRGILRLHQFDKLEMESFTTPENGVNEQNFFVAIQEYLMQSLKLPYQVVAICTGDMSSPDVRQIDIETWMPGQNRYRETHTSDYVADYQSRRLGTRVKHKNNETEFAHMNDATVFAIGRTLIAIMENYQTEDGKIRVPEILQPYLKKEFIG